MDKELTNRINELARKQKEEGLTDEEKKEQEELRQRYLKEFREYFRKRLENIDIEYVEDQENDDEKDTKN